MSTKQTKVKEKDAERFFFQEIFVILLAILLVRFIPFLKWAHEERGLPIVNYGVTCDFFLLKFRLHV